MADSNTSNGIGFWGALVLIFIVLKLTNNIDWSWWWVLSPIWMGIGVVIILALLYFVLYGMRAKRLKKKLGKKKKSMWQTKLEEVAAKRTGDNIKKINQS